MQVSTLLSQLARPPSSQEGGVCWVPCSESAAICNRLGSPSAAEAAWVICTLLPFISVPDFTCYFEMPSRTKVGLWNYAQAAARSALAASGAPTSTATDTAPPSASGGQAGQAAGAVPSSGTSVTIPAHSSSIPAPVPVVPLIKTIAGGSYTAPAGPGPFGQPRLSGGDDVFGLSAAAGPSNLPPGSSAPVVGLASLTGPSSSSAAAGHTASIAASPAPAHPPSSTTSTPSIPRAAQRASGAGAVTPAATPTGATRAEAGTARPSGSSTSSLHETFDPVGQHRSWCPWVFTGGWIMRSASNSIIMQGCSG
jgi:hypothetical protein